MLNLCDSPVAGSVIISAALVPALSLLLNELFKFVVSVNKELANSFQLSHSSFFSSRAISLSWSDAFLTFKAHEHDENGDLRKIKVCVNLRKVGHPTLRKLSTARKGL